jgi:hypothetical protein
VNVYSPLKKRDCRGHFVQKVRALNDEGLEYLVDRNSENCHETITCKSLGLKRKKKAFGYKKSL